MRLYPLTMLFLSFCLFQGFAAADEKLPLHVRSAGNGLWSVAKTWEGGKVPGKEARVQIRTGHRVVYDAKAGPVIRSIHVAGTLTFAKDRDTQLDVGLIKIQAGDDASEDGFDCDSHALDPDPKLPQPALEVGTANEPIPAKHGAVIRLHYIAGMDKLSCPAIVCCAGRMDLHGAPMNRTWVKLGATAKAGATSVTLADAVTGWKVGDRAIITATQPSKSEMGTRRPGVRNRSVATEERTIKALGATEITFDAALQHEHLGDGEFRGAVANLSRNVIIESADRKMRGHTMYHRGSAGSISYAEFRHLGKENVLGRYSIHYHLVGNTMRGSYVLGASIWDSGNRWVTVHGTNYLIVRDCVGYQSVGHGFFLEDGTEVFNVFDRNLAVQAYLGKPLPKQALPFDHNEGAGFWWANSLNTFTGNVACENDRYGYRFEATPTSSFKLTLPILQPDGSRKMVDIRTLPFVRFEDNEAICDGLYGFNLGEGVNRVGPDTRHPFVIRNMKIWGMNYGFRPQSPCVLTENMVLHRTNYGVYHPNFDNHVYRNLRINGDMSEPFNRGHDDLSVQHGIVAVDGLTFENVRGPVYSIPLIQITDNNATGKAAAHFRNVKVVRAKDSRRSLLDIGGGAWSPPETPHGVPVYLHDHFGPGRHAKVVSTEAKDFPKDEIYRAEPPLTGHKARMAEVKGVAFPDLLHPVDDLPPTTVITHVIPLKSGEVLVRGTTSDNGTIKAVFVNKQRAKPSRPNFTEWQVTLPGLKTGTAQLEAWAEDAAGNREKTPHHR